MPPLIHIALVGCFVLLVVLAITGAIVVTRAALRQRRRPHGRQDYGVDPGTGLADEEQRPNSPPV
ncbi:hypothetical protein [Gordonia sp. NPDC058843]|uniref:hypothetical protein n=1 Tax=Gordonia sp. NPDC058843 TaxID=3346648 RepID=UPI0036C80B6E